MDVAVKIVEQIKNVMPDWKIFFDQNDLRVGTAWQLKLYSSVGKYFFFFFQKALNTNNLSKQVSNTKYF